MTIGNNSKVIGTREWCFEQLQETQEAHVSDVAAEIIKALALDTTQAQLLEHCNVKVMVRYRVDAIGAIAIDL